MKEKAFNAIKGFGRGLAYLYRKWGFVKCAVGLILIVSTVNVLHNMPPAAPSVARVEVVKPECGPEVGPYDYSKHCVYVGKNPRMKMHVGAHDCPLLLTSAMAVPLESIKFVKEEAKDGKTLYLFERQGDGYHVEYVCANVKGDVQVMWAMYYPGEKPSYSRWHNLNTEDF